MRYNTLATIFNELYNDDIPLVYRTGVPREITVPLMVINHSRVGRVLSGVYVFVCLPVFFAHDVSKTDAASITKHDRNIQS